MEREVRAKEEGGDAKIIFESGIFGLDLNEMRKHGMDLYRSFHKEQANRTSCYKHTMHIH